MARNNGPDIRPARNEILRQSLRMQDIERSLTEAAAAVLDAKQEVEHWRKAFAHIQAEMDVIMKVMMHKRGLRRVVISEAEFKRVPESLQLMFSNPEPGIRVYELREGATKPAPLLQS
jgi:hypothetical protein